MSRDVYFEFRRQGAYVKVSAIDPVNNIEVSIVGGSNMPEQMLKAAALRKLDFMLAKQGIAPSQK